MSEHPLAAPIDRALDGRIYAGAGSHSDYRAKVRDAILAEIEAEYGPVTVERRRGGVATGKKPDPDDIRLVSEWRAAR